MSKKVHLITIDPQQDFCDPGGALFVPGADEDAARLSAMVDRLCDKIDDIHVTMDSHQVFHIAHPIFWKNADGDHHPDPFTVISHEDVRNGVWSPLNPNFRDWALRYTEKLEANKRYVLCVWPPHCIIGSTGHSLVPSFSDAIQRWCHKNSPALVNFVTKGSNWKTEHYSAVQADVPDDEDPSTQLHEGIISSLQEADVIAITGQALSHCVANTIRDIAGNFGEENVKKFVLITDTCSNVPGFENLGEDFVNEMRGRGMQTSTSDLFLA